MGNVSNHPISLSLLKVTNQLTVRRRDTQHNDTRRNDLQHYDIRNDIPSIKGLYVTLSIKCFPFLYQINQL